MAINNISGNFITSRFAKLIKTPVNYKPIKWSQYFNTYGGYTSDAGYFHYYSRGTVGPILICLHGGGYSGLTWSLFAREISTRIQCRVIAADLRGHGNTDTVDEHGLSLEQFKIDVKELIHSFSDEENKEPPIILIGHSLGGAIAVAVAQDTPNVIGIIIIDVVEGTALDSLSIMQGILHRRPEGFQTIEQAVQWGARGGTTKNLEAARVSMPGQIKNVITNIIASEEVDLDIALSTKDISNPITPGSISTIEEGDESKSSDIKIEQKLFEGKQTKSSTFFKTPIPSSSNPKKNGINYVWRIDLTKTAIYWNGWFKGLSQKFLDLQCPKILLLANISGLDTSLTVGQMQGKFQLKVLSHSGHAVHEDEPEQVADIVASFLCKQKLAQTLNKC